MIAPASPAFIVGTSRITPVSMKDFDGGIVAQLSGPGLIRVLDAAMIGDGAIQLWTEGAALRPLQVIEIAMQGTSTLVTFEDAVTPIAMN